MRATGLVVFVGAGPGAADLITVRGARRIGEADLVLWPFGTVSPDGVNEYVRPGAELVDSSRLGGEPLLRLYRRAAAKRLTVAVVHCGELTIDSELTRQYQVCRRLGMQVELVPGVSAVLAAAAAAGRELPASGSIITTKVDDGAGPLPAGNEANKATLAVVGSGARAGTVADRLRAAGYAEDTPVVVAHKVSWPDELVVQTTVAELECTVRKHKLWGHTIFLIDPGATRFGSTITPRSNGYRWANPSWRRAARNTS